jgi:predicted esterase YcpF (UPF0227 family)
MILFVHGLGSCGWGGKSLALRRHFGLEHVIAPDLPFRPDAALDKLCDLVSRYPVQALVGSSMGGFLATRVNAWRGLPTILVNPVVRPHRLLAGHIGRHTRWCDERPFNVDADYLDVLAQMHRETLSAGECYLVMLQQGDEILDYRQAEAYYANFDVVCEPGGDHRFAGFDDHLPDIAAWLARHGVDTQTWTMSMAG